MEDKKSYYAVIPATVRYDNKISPGAKLLYGEITALCSEKGFCWASNQYFMDLYSVSKSTVVRWINDLESNGYIVKNLMYDEDGKTVIQRCLSIENHVAPGVKNDTRGCQKCNHPGVKNDTRGGVKNDTYNNTVINNTMNNNPIIPLTKEQTNLIAAFNFAEEVNNLIYDWLGYKKDKGQTYKGTKGLNFLLCTVKKILDNGGDLKACMSYSMSNNYSGLFEPNSKSKASYDINKIKKKFCEIDDDDKDFIDYLDSD